jgi:hypothetical protein
VSAFAALPATGNSVGDVRMVTGLSRAFTWNGTGWVALAVDENGNLQVPGTVAGQYLQVTSTSTSGTACPDDGLISKDSRGQLLSCQSGRWSNASSSELAYTETGSSIILPSGYISYPGGTQFYSGSFAYDSAFDTVTAVITRDIRPTKDALVLANVNAAMHRGQVTATAEEAQYTLVVEVINRDNGAVMATNTAMSPRFTYDASILAATLSKAVRRNTNGYTIRLTVRWTTYMGSYAGNFYNRSNYQNNAGTVVETTPLQVGWSFDVSY